MTLQKDSTRSIAASLARFASIDDSSHRKTIKYPAFKKIVHDILIAHPAHTRLPPVRLLAESLGISLVTAHRVITELIADGIVYSRSRAGVYIAEKNTSSASSAGSLSVSGNPSFESRFRFGTESRTDFQRPLWSGMLARFSERYPNTRPELTFVNDTSELARSLDVYERLDWNIHWAGDENLLLDLRKFATDEIASHCTEQGTLPLYFRSNYIFYNSSLLKKIGAPLPAYKSFSQQTEYLKTISPILRASGFNPQPLSVQQPITSLGCSHLELYFSLIYAARSNRGELAAFTASAEKALDFCRLSQRAPGFQSPKASEGRLRFMAGHDPLFLGHSVDFWEFGQASMSFKAGCYPVLCTDESLFLWPMIGCVSRQSRRPAESIRFLSYLIGHEAQNQFIQTGNFPVNRRVTVMPETAADPAWLANVFSNSRPIHLPTTERFYLAINVLNNELWHALLDHVSVEQAVKEAVHLGRAYLSQHLASHANA